MWQNRPDADPADDRLVDGDASELDGELRDERGQEDGPLGPRHRAFAIRPQDEYGADRVEGTRQSEQQARRNDPTARPFHRGPDEEAQGDGERHDPQREHEQHGHEHELRRHGQPGEDLELDPRDECERRDEYRDGEEPRIAVLGDRQQQPAGDEDERRPHDDDGPPLAGVERRLADDALCAHSLVRARVVEQARARLQAHVVLGRRHHDHVSAAEPRH